MSEAPKLSQVIRLDSLPLNQTYFTPEGYLMDRPILTSTGIFEYTNPDGSVRRELRLPEEVFAAESLASYQGKPSSSRMMRVWWTRTTSRSTRSAPF